MKQLAMNGSNSDTRLDAIINKLAAELAKELGCSGEENLILSDSDICKRLRKQAQKIVRKEDEEKARAEEKRRSNILLAAKEKLGLLTSKPKTSLTLVPPKEQGPSAWKKYLEGKERGFLPPVFQSAVFDSVEAVSAARGFLIGEFKKISSTQGEEPTEEAKVWRKRAQGFLDKINSFFPNNGKGGIPLASYEMLCQVRELIMSEAEMAWFLDGPEAIAKELAQEEEKKHLEKERREANRQRELARQRHIESMKEALLAGGVLDKEAEKLAKALAKRFPELTPEKAFAEMATLRQAEAILRDKRFLEEMAPEAELYTKLAGLKAPALIAKARQQSGVAAHLKRHDPGYGEMRKSSDGSKNKDKKKGSKR